GARSTLQALKRGHIFNDSTARLKRLRKKSHCGSRLPSAAKAAIDFATLTARLKPRPFKAKSRTRVFPQPVNSCPSQTGFDRSFLRKLLKHSNDSGHDKTIQVMTMKGIGLCRRAAVRG